MGTMNATGKGDRNQLSRARTGFMFADAMIGMAVLGTVMVILGVGLAREHRSAETLSQSRRAMRAAEAALADLQAGRAMPAEFDGAALHVQETKSTAAPAGFHWVEVRATVGGRQAALAGLVPADAKAGGTR
jgi:Tfp pilus assembly protein PilX